MRRILQQGSSIQAETREKSTVTAGTRAKQPDSYTGPPSIRAVPYHYLGGESALSSRQSQEGLNGKIMKKLLACLLCLMLLIPSFSASAEEDREVFLSGDYEYALLDDKTVEITGYTGNDETLEIPSAISGKRVTSIGSSAFYSCRSLRTAAIPDSIVHIGSNPFNNCGFLEEFRISPGHPVFAVINGVLFDKAEKKLITYPGGLSASDYTIPAGVRIIGEAAFYQCSRLSRVTMPDSVTAIEDFAFYSCRGLRDITVSNSAASIGPYAFSFCSSLSSITIPDSVLSIGDSAFYMCKNLDHVVIPDGVASIGSSAFYKCDSLSRVTIPDSVLSIGNFAFYKCGSLHSVTIPDSVMCIGINAFASCAQDLTITAGSDSYARSYCVKNDLKHIPADGTAGG